MTSKRVPLGILDLVPVSSGSTPARALRNSIDLARTAEQLGYRRYWFAEHHLNPGVAGSSPVLLIAMAAAATDRIRVGSGGVQSGHRTALSVVEEFGLLDAMYPGRIDLGIGRSGGRNFLRDRLAVSSRTKTGDGPSPEPRRTENGLLIPAAPSLRGLGQAPRIALTADLLQQQNAESADYGDLIENILGLLHGSYRSSDGLDPLSGTRNGSRRRTVDPRQQCGRECRGCRSVGSSVRRQLSHQPGHRSRGCGGVPEGLRPVATPRSPLCGRLRRRRGRSRRRECEEAGRRLRTLGQEHSER